MLAEPLLSRGASGTVPDALVEAVDLTVVYGSGDTASTAVDSVGFTIGRGEQVA
ncbi:MAG: hypothetical protein JWR01_561, partial [Subtercola sp.]|nr:hypothetical protein [Subtercola sp.]